MICKYLSKFCPDFELSADLIEKIRTKGMEILTADKKADQFIKLILINDIGVEIYEETHLDELIDII